MEAVLLERWKRFSPEERLGHIGSEFSQAVAAKRSGDGTVFEEARKRLSDLIEATVSLEESPPRKRELELMRYAVSKTLEDTRLLENNSQILQDYFTHFGILALQRGNKKLTH